MHAYKLSEAVTNWENNINLSGILQIMHIYTRVLQ